MGGAGLSWWSSSRASIKGASRLRVGGRGEIAIQEIKYTNNGSNYINSMRYYSTRYGCVLVYCKPRVRFQSFIMDIT